MHVYCSLARHRTIQISADIESTLEIITEMLKYFEEVSAPKPGEIPTDPDLRPQRDEDFDVRLLIHQSLAGCVIGKGGQKIKEIRDVSNRTLLNFLLIRIKWV